jgi:hypothetical protein
MAQVTGGSDFDSVWEEVANASLLLLREASDLFAKGGENAIAADVVVASLLGILAKSRPSNLYWARAKWPPRFFDGAVEPPAVRHSFQKLAPRHQHEDCDAVVTELKAVISPAAKEWALGNPEQPDAREVLRELFGLLWSRRLIPRPPAKAYPLGL